MINPRAGSIVISGDVEIGDVVVSHKNIVVEAVRHRIVHGDRRRPIERSEAQATGRPAQLAQGADARHDRNHSRHRAQRQAARTADHRVSRSATAAMRPTRTNAMTAISNIQVPMLGPPNVPTSLGRVNTAANRFEKPDFGDKDEAPREVHAVRRRNVLRADDQVDAVDGRQAGLLSRRPGRRSVSGPARSAAGRASDRSHAPTSSPSRCSAGSFRIWRPRTQPAAPSLRRILGSTSEPLAGANSMQHEATPTTDTRDTLESDIAGLLSELSAVQTDLLGVLTRKRDAARGGRRRGARRHGARRSRTSSTRLQACHERRQRLLAQAAGEGLPSDSIKSLSKSLPAEQPKSPARRARRSAAALATCCSTSASPTGC